LLSKHKALSSNPIAAKGKVGEEARKEKLRQKTGRQSTEKQSTAAFPHPLKYQ
jgi:hypothetical protein